MNRHAAAWPPTEHQLAQGFLAHFGMTRFGFYDGLVRWCREVGIHVSTRDLPHDMRVGNFWHEKNMSIVLPVNGGCFISREHTLLHELRELLEHNFWHLDFDARYYRNVWGRFTTADPLHASARLTDPQSFNRYAYAYNNPPRFVDPDGLDVSNKCIQDPKCTIVVNVNVIFDDTREWTDAEQADFERDQLAAAQARFARANIILKVTYTFGTFMRDKKKVEERAVKENAVNVVVTRQITGSGYSTIDKEGNRFAVINDRAAASFLQTGLFPWSTLEHELGHIFRDDVVSKSNVFANHFADLQSDAQLNRLASGDAVFSGYAALTFRLALERQRYSSPLAAVATTPRQ